MTEGVGRDGKGGGLTIAERDGEGSDGPATGAKVLLLGFQGFPFLPSSDGFFFRAAGGHEHSSFQRATEESAIYNPQSAIQQLKRTMSAGRKQRNAGRTGTTGIREHQLRKARRGLDGQSAPARPPTAMVKGENTAGLRYWPHAMDVFAFLPGCCGRLPMVTESAWPAAETWRGLEGGGSYGNVEGFVRPWFQCASQPPVAFVFDTTFAAG